MKQDQIVTEVISAIEKKNWDKVENHLADNFTFSGAVPNPISKKEWLGVHRALQTGIPDLKLNLHNVAVKGDKVTAKVKLAGTHTATLPSPMPGVSAIPSTGKRVEMPEEDIEITFKGDKLLNFYVKPSPHGGVMGILEQLGGGADTANANLRVVQQGFSEFRSGNIQALLDRCTDDIQWGTYHNPTVPFAKTWKGKNEVKQFFKLLTENITFTEFEPTEFVAQNETVLILAHQKGKVTTTGKTFELDVCICCKLRNQKIYSIFSYTDSRQIAEAFK